MKRYYNLKRLWQTPYNRLYQAISTSLCEAILALVNTFLFQFCFNYTFKKTHRENDFLLHTFETLKELIKKDLNHVWMSPMSQSD